MKFRQLILPIVSCLLIPNVAHTSEHWADAVTDKATAEQALADATENENSMANRMLGGATMGAMGIGGQLAMAGMAEQRADDEWGKRIAAVEDGMYCRIANRPGQIHVNASETTPMITRNAVEMRAEYLELAQMTRDVKSELGLPPGIEAAIIIDMRDTYDAAAVRDAPTQLRDSTAQERAESGDAAQRRQTGTAVLIGGAAVGIVGNVMGSPQIGNSTDNKKSSP